MTVGIIACVEPTTAGTSTTTTTTAGSTAAVTSPTTAVPTMITAITSGTTVVPTSVATTSGCQKDMAIVGGPYVSSVTYPATKPVQNTINTDLTTDTGNGITFPQVPVIPGLRDSDNKPLYIISINFKSPGVSSLGSVAVKPKPDSNVETFAVEFYAPSSPNQPFTLEPNAAPLSFPSKPNGTTPFNDVFPDRYVPSPLIGIRFIVLSTTDSL